MHGQETLKKSVKGGWILLILGVTGLVLAAAVYPDWQHARRVLAARQFYMIDTPEDHAKVDTLTVLMLGGLLVGTPMLFGGAYVVATRSSPRKSP